MTRNYDEVINYRPNSNLNLVQPFIILMVSYWQGQADWPRPRLAVALQRANVALQRAAVALQQA
eukprot:scaffold19393_cov63-Cyclotella_meneghiniana.AAC.1